MDITSAPDKGDEESMHTPYDLFYSPAEKENLLLIKQEFDGEFPVGTAFSTRRHLIDAMREKATKGLSLTVAWRHVALRQLQGTPQTQKGSKFVNCLLRKMEKHICPENVRNQSVGVSLRLTLLGWRQWRK